MRVLRVRSMSEFFSGFFMAANLFNYVVAREEGLYLYLYIRHSPAAKRAEYAWGELTAIYAGLSYSSALAGRYRTAPLRLDQVQTN